MIGADEIKQMVAAGESYNVDFKQSVPAKVRDITQEVCSFANAAGGYVLIGVRDDNTIVGYEMDNSKRSAVQDSIGEISPALHVSLYPVEVDEKTVWVIEVPARRQMPYFFGGCVYVREGANSQKLTNAEEVRQLFQQNEKIYYDSIPDLQFKLMDNLDEDTFTTYRREAGISINVPDEQVLANTQIWDDERHVKRGGIMFFAKNPQLLYFHAIVRCVEYKGTDKLAIIDDKTFGGTLFKQYEQAIMWIQSKLRLSYQITGAGARTEQWEIPIEVFREALVNAICHRDYYEQGAFTMVEVYDDRVEVSNPGGLLPIVAREFGRRSLARNPLIFSLFMRMRLVEHVGSGIARMQVAMKNAGLPAPQFITQDMFSVTFYRHSDVDVAHLTDLEQKVLDAVTSTPKPTINEICNRVGRQKTTVYRTINALRTKGALLNL